MRRSKIIFYCFFLLLATAGGGLYAAETTFVTAADIMMRAYEREDGQTRSFVVTMTLEDKNANKRIRQLKTMSKDYGPLMKSYLEFTDPPDIKGTKFLSWENDDKDDTQYLYLPALGKARRVVSSQKKLRFVNTDYTYEDMQRRHPDKDTHILLGRDYYQGYYCYIVGSDPKEGTSQYSKRISWIDRDTFVIIRVNFFGAKHDKTKEFRVLALENYDGIWTPTQTVMFDLKESSATYMDTKEVIYNKEIDDSQFSIQALSKN